jgi:hypothetical protein
MAGIGFDRANLTKRSGGLFVGQFSALMGCPSI